MSEIFEVIRKGDSDRFKKLLSEDKNLVFERDDEGNTPLHIAALYRKAGIAEVLLISGAEVNAVNHAGLHPIDAVNDGKYRFLDIRNFVYNVLIKHGAYLAKPRYTQRQLSYLHFFHNIIFAVGIIMALMLTYYVIGVSCRWLPKSDWSYIPGVLLIVFILGRAENVLRDILLPYKNTRDGS